MIQRATNSLLKTSSRASLNHPRTFQIHISHANPRCLWLEAATSSAQLFQYAHHSIGLEWYLAIPAVAVVFNFTIRFPLNIYTTWQLARRKKLEPLVKAWRDVHMFDAYTTAMREPVTAGTPARTSPVDVRKAIETKTRDLVTVELRRINKLWGVQHWKSVVASLASLPPYMIFVGALSALSGNDRGWVKLMLPSSQWVDDTLTSGGLLWFQNLAEADPMGALPVATMLLFWFRSFNVIGRESTIMALGNGDKTNMTSFSATVIRLQYLYPIAFAVLGQWISAGGLLFILSSTLASLLNRPLADRLLKNRINRLHTLDALEPQAPATYISGRGRQI